MNKSTLYIFSGLPGSGKSTLAQELANVLKASYLRIDTVEQGLKDLCKMDTVEGEGYRLSYLIAKDSLKSGVDVIADSVNPIELTRREWNDVATSVGSSYQNIEIICSNAKEHRSRVENRKAGVVNLRLPTWQEVCDREYHLWNSERIVIDTAGRTIRDCAQELFQKIRP